MRRELIRSLHRKYVGSQTRFGVRFSFDDPGTIRLLPFKWTDKADRSIGIHKSIPVDDMKLEAFPEGPMAIMQSEGGSDSAMFAFVSIFGHAGILFDGDEWEKMKIFKVFGDNKVKSLNSRQAVSA